MTPQQRQTLDFIEQYIAENRVSPSMREIQRAMGDASPSGAYRRVQGLMASGHLRRTGAGTNRNLALVAADLHTFTTGELLAELARRTEETAHG